MQRQFKIWLFWFCCLTFINWGCKEEETTQANLVLKFKFDPNQARLNNLGQPSSVPAGHAAQSPTFNGMSAHYAELAQTAFTPLGSGEVLFKSEETTTGGATAIDFEKSTIVNDGEVFFSVPLKEVKAGTYEYLRVSLAYQNYNIELLVNGNVVTGTLASFVGFNTYIKTFSPNQSQVVVNANKKQGYWAFEALGNITQGQAPDGATTVPNPIAGSSPIPAGSCVVTGQFIEPFVIKGNEAQDVVIEVSLSINKSFEWVEVNANGQFEPLAGEAVVDMGIRGLVPIVK